MRYELKAQAAVEMLTLAGFAIVFIIPLALLFLSTSNVELGKASVVQAKASARTIADEAGEIYLQGEGARKSITVNYPDGVKNGSVEANLVVLTIETADGRTIDIVATTFAELQGNLSGKRTAGLQRIRLVNEGRYVNVTYE